MGVDRRFGTVGPNRGGGASSLLYDNEPTGRVEVSQTPSEGLAVSPLSRPVGSRIPATGLAGARRVVIAPIRTRLEWRRRLMANGHACWAKARITLAQRHHGLAALALSTLVTISDRK